jgi:hypothetical protein
MIGSTFAAILGILITGYFAYKIFAGVDQKSLVCRSCGTVNNGRLVTRGSFVIEIILWICFLLPGLVYSIWRYNTQFTACNACGGKEMIPVDSPIGRQIVAQNAVKVLS